jgi:tripartite-type tricarboxylate transporter receptor subunit TctC
MLWAGLFAPAGTPTPVLETLQKAVVETLKSQPVLESYARQNVRSNPTATLAEAQTWLNSEIASWQKITSEIKIDLTD